MSDSTLFAVIYKPGPRWEAGVAFHGQPGIVAHRDFLFKQYEDGTLAFGGPFLDHTGGVAVFHGSSLEQMEAVLNEDETIINGLQTFEVHPLALPFKPRT